MEYRLAEVGFMTKHSFSQAFILLIFLTLGIHTCWAQQSPQHSLYMIDKYQINPAYAGFDKSLSINFNYRSQWSGLNGSPKQTYVNAHLPIYLLDGGVGVMFRNDNTGLLNFQEFSASYNRVFRVAGGTLSAGLRAGFIQRKINGAEITTPQGVYNQGVIQHNDPILFTTTAKGISPIWSAGVFFRSDFFDGGLTISDFQNGLTTIETAGVAANKMISGFGQFSSVINEIEFLPSLLFKTNGQFFQSDISLLAKSGSVFGGISLRGISTNSLESVIILGGLKLNDHYTLTYSYDLGINKFRNVSSGSHEIQINYNLNKLIGIGLLPEVIYNPRNL